MTTMPPRSRLRAWVQFIFLSEGVGGFFLAEARGVCVKIVWVKVGRSKEMKL